MLLFLFADVSIRLECLKGREELEKLQQFIEKRKKRIRVAKPTTTTASIPTPPAGNPMKTQRTTPPLLLPKPCLNKKPNIRYKQKWEECLSDALPMPPPSPCPGILEKIQNNPLKIYDYPTILLHFQPYAQHEHESYVYNLNNVAKALTKNLEDVKTFHTKRASLFEKVSECHRRSRAYTGMVDPLNIGNAEELTK